MPKSLHVLLIALSANLDNLAVGIAYGIRRIRTPVVPNLVIAAMAFIFTFSAATAGQVVGALVPQGLADIVGGLILIGTGVWVLRHQLGDAQARQQLPPQKAVQETETCVWDVARVLREPELADADQSGGISLTESLILGVALSANCVANGLSAGLWHLGAVEMSLVTALLSYLTLWGGIRLGKRFAAAWLGQGATLVAGGLLMLLGLAGCLQPFV